MDELIKKVKGAMRRCLGGVKECPMCEYYEGDRCPDEINRDTLKVIAQMEEQNKELLEENERLSEKLKDVWKLGQSAPPMPCNVGDPLWAVFEEKGMISVTKTVCKALLWNGGRWLISEDECCWEVPDEEYLFLSIEEAVKKAEEMLRNGNDA